MSIAIAHITDTHLDEAFLAEHQVDARARWLRILEDVSERGIREVVFGGDIGEASTHAWILQSLKEKGLHARFILGNHDSFGQFKKHLPHSPERDGLYYSEEDDNGRFIFLDSSTERIPDRQLQWLAAQTNGSLRKLIFIHHPVLAVDTPVDRQYPLQNREDLKAIIERLEGEAMLFCGHYHMPDFRLEGKLRQLITPAASYQIVKEAPEISMDTTWFGYRIIMAGPSSLETSVIRFFDGLPVTTEPMSLTF